MRIRTWLIAGWVALIFLAFVATFAIPDDPVVGVQTIIAVVMVGMAGFRCFIADQKTLRRRLLIFLAVFVCISLLGVADAIGGREAVNAFALDPQSSIVICYMA